MGAKPCGRPILSTRNGGRGGAAKRRRRGGNALCECLPVRERGNAGALRHNHFFHLKKQNMPTATASMNRSAAG
jgi:hypothetical protein